MMKKKTILTVFIALMSILTAFGASKTEKFKVYGKCAGMCGNRIEKAAKSVEGVASASWDYETKMIEVSFDSSKTDVHKVHKAIANAGHDTEMHKASDEVYNNLPGCCKYERDANKGNSEAHSDCSKSEKESDGCDKH